MTYYVHYSQKTEIEKQHPLSPTMTHLFTRLSFFYQFSQFTFSKLIKSMTLDSKIY